MRLRWWLCLVLGLAGCQGESSHYTSDYLMVHPTALKNEMVRCQSIIQSSGQSNAYCGMVADTMERFFAILVEQQRDPEKFGQRIIKAQQAYGQALNQVELSKQTLETKVAAHATDADIQTAQVAYEASLAAAAKAKTTVDQLLVIVGQSSPE